MGVSIIGILDDGWDGLSKAAQLRIASAELLVAASRTLEGIRPHLPPSCETRRMDGALAQLPAWIEAALATGQTMVVLASGDPLCHGIASSLLNRLDPAQVSALEILPAPSTLQIACARWRTAWQDIAIASCHGPDAGEWYPGATFEHGLYATLRAVALNRRVFVFTSPANDPARLARALLAAGYGAARICVASRLLRADERIWRNLAASEVAAMEFPAPCVMLIERQDANSPSFGCADDEYLQRQPEQGLITKQEVRAISLAKLRLTPDAIVWDIGAGSGSVGLEAARLAPLGHVWAIEKNAADAAIARANAEKFRVGNYTLITGKAPAGLADWPDPDAVFIGGSGGELAELIRVAFRRLKPAGRLVLNLVTLENLALAHATLRECDAAWEVVQVQISRSKPILGMYRLAAQNPVWIIAASKEVA